MDGEVVYHRRRKLLDFGLKQRFAVDGVECHVRVIPTPWLTFWYWLWVDGIKQRASQRNGFGTGCVIACFLFAIFAISIGFVGLVIGSFDVIVLASLQESRIGDPPDIIDAYVPDGHSDQYYYVAFGKLRVLKGVYAKDKLGIRLHSPALTFGIRDDKFKGRRYLLFLQKVVASDGRKVLLLREYLKTSQ